MNEIMRWECTPQEYLTELFKDTQDGKLPIMYYTTGLNCPYKSVYKVSWTSEDLEFLLNEYERLTAAFEKIGTFHDNLDALTDEERTVWETYIRPYEPFDVDESEINTLKFRGEYDQLSDLEYDLLERHYEWEEEQSLKRLPHKGDSPKDLIEAARWYTYHAQYSSEKKSLYEFGRTLMRELLLYYYMR